MNKYEQDDLRAQLRARALNLNEQQGDYDEHKGDVMERREDGHSPLPWRVGGSFSEFIVSNVGSEPSVARATGITRDEAEANARYIVKCVNEHTTLTEQRDRLAAVLRQIQTAATNVASYDRALADIKKLAKDALATVEQGGGEL